MRYLTLWIGWAGCGGGVEGGDDANVCEQALHFTQECMGDPPTGSVVDADCDESYACVSGCMLDAPCEVLVYGQAPNPPAFQELYDCEVACQVATSPAPTDPTAPTTPPPTTPGTTPTTTTQTWTETDTGPRPECVEFADVYCGCLGNYASDTCEEDMADTCDWAYDLDPTFYDCVVAQQCQGDWVTACS